MAQSGKPLPMVIRQTIREYLFDRRFSERRTAALLDLHRNTVRKYGKKCVPPMPTAS